MLRFENAVKEKGYTFIVGIDEVGRGPLAGPVVVGAVLLKEFKFKARIDDSKKLTKLQREAAFFEIIEKAFYGLGIVNEGAVDSIHIAKAVELALDNAVLKLLAHCASLKPCVNNVFLLMDGALRSSLPYASKVIIGGDHLSLSIACASIVAKVARDRIMDIYHRVYPEYGFAFHKGYGTKAHRDNICRYGLSPIHRRSFCRRIITHEG